MGEVGRANISLLKQYEQSFAKEENNFNNATYTTFTSSYLKNCSDSYVQAMASKLQEKYNTIKNGYNSINTWWSDYNSKLETLESSLANGGKQNNFDISANLLLKSTQAGTAFLSIKDLINRIKMSDVKSSAFNHDTMDSNSSVKRTYNSVTKSKTQSTASSNDSKNGKSTALSFNKEVNCLMGLSTVQSLASLLKGGAKVLNKIAKSSNSSGLQSTSSGTASKSSLNSSNSFSKQCQKGFASVGNGVVALSKGCCSVVEALGDVAAIGSTTMYSSAALAVDGYSCLFLGQKGLDATTKLWNTAKTVVSYNWTNKVYNSLYNTKIGKALNNNAVKYMKSDSTACQVIDGIGYTAGVVAISVLTFGTATPVAVAGTTAGTAAGTSSIALATTAATAGLGKYTAEEWNKNKIVLTNSTNKQIDLSIDYQQYLALNKLTRGTTKQISQPAVGVTGKEVKYNFTALGNGKFKITDSLGNSFNLVNSKESNTAKGLAIGSVKGLWEGLQYYVGAKIGNAKFDNIIGLIKNPVVQKLATSGIKVALDTVTGIVEVPFQSCVSMAEDNINYSQAWKENGGWNSVISQAGIAGFSSLLGEAFSLSKSLKNNTIDVQSNIVSDVNTSLKDIPTDFEVPSNPLDKDSTAVIVPISDLVDIISDERKFKEFTENYNQTGVFDNYTKPTYVDAFKQLNDYLKKNSSSIDLNEAEKVRLTKIVSTQNNFSLSGVPNSFNVSFDVNNTTKIVPVTDLFDIISDDEKYSDFVNAGEGTIKNGMFENCTRSEYAEGYKQLKKYLDTSGSSSELSELENKRIENIIEQFDNPITIKYQEWTERYMPRKIKNILGDYVSDDKINALNGKTEFLDEETFKKQCTIKGAGGYNNSTKSFVSLERPAVAKSTANHENMHELSALKVSDTEEYRGYLKYNKTFNPSTYCFETTSEKARGFNEAVTELVNQKVMAEDYPQNASGYIQSVNRLKELLNLNVPGFDFDTLAKGYFHSNGEYGTGALATAIDNVTYSGFFDCRLIPAFEQVYSGDSNGLKDLDMVVSAVKFYLSGAIGR